SLLSLAGCAEAPALPASSPRDTASRRQDAKQTMKKILILGGTKFIGPSIVEIAMARGHTVTLFNRGKTNPGLFPNVEKLHGDRRRDLKALSGRKWDGVIDTSGFGPRIVKASAELLSPNVEQYMFISSISAYADFSHPSIDESSKVAVLPDPKSED